MTPAHRGRAASGQASCSLIQLAAVSTCCPHWFTERAPVRDPNAAEPQPAVAKYRDTARQAAVKTERHDPRTPRKGRLRPGLFILQVLAALAEPDTPHSRKAAAAAERHDLALIQPLLPEPASDEHSLTLAVLHLHCATNVYPELCTLGFLQPSGLRSLPVCLWKVGVLHDFSDPCQHVFALLRKKLPSGSALGETPQEHILRPAELHTTGQCESTETSLHTNIPISRAPLNYAGEGKVPYLW